VGHRPGIAHDWYQERQITVELPEGDGVVSETVRYADAIAFIVLKALAFDTRHERKDAADLIHVMRYAGPIEELAHVFADRMRADPYSVALAEAVAALKRRFCDDEETEGFRKDGPAAYASFHGLNDSGSDERIRAMREISGMVAYFVERIEDARAAASSQA
jgi:hypothetical protein